MKHGSQLRNWEAAGSEKSSFMQEEWRAAHFTQTHKRGKYPKQLRNGGGGHSIHN